MASALKPFGKLEPLSSAAPWAVYGRKRLDIHYNDLMYGIMKAVTAREADRDYVLGQLREVWTGEDTMVTLSVRTSWDLLFRVLTLKQGSEVIMSGITIKDMVDIVEYHGLAPIAVDLNINDLSMRMDLLKQAITKDTKVLIISHLFGTRSDFADVIELAHEHGIIVVEDCAEAYVGPEYKGNDDADISLFSFGTIKTQTAIGGCVARIKDDDLREAHELLYDSYPTRSRAFFAKRLSKYVAAHGLTSPVLYGPLMKLIDAITGDFEGTITAMSRGFAGGDFFTLIRQRPSMPLLYLLWKRLAEWDPSYIQLRIERGRTAVELIKDIPGAQIPGVDNKHHAFWLFPVMVADPPRVCRIMSAQGFDVTQGTTQLGPALKYVREPSALCKEMETPNCWHMMNSIVYLPVTAEIMPKDLERLVAALREAVAPMSKL